MPSMIGLVFFLLISYVHAALQVGPSATYTTIQSAIAAASAAAPLSTGAVINVAPTTASATVDLAPLLSAASSVGPLTHTIQCQGGRCTVDRIDALNVVSSPATVRLIGFDLNCADGANACVVIQNIASTTAGQAATVQFDSCTFSNAPFRAVEIAATNVEFISSQFANNGALTTFEGSAVLLDNTLASGLAWTITVFNSTFTDNTASERGAGISVLSTPTSPSLTLKLNYSSFDGHTVVTNGGAVFAQYCAFLIDHSSFTFNTATNGGGAVHSDLGTSLKITNSIFNYNSITHNNFQYFGAYGGGAIIFFNFDPFNPTVYGTIEIYNCHFEFNNAGNPGAGQSGGAVQVFGASFVEDCTFLNNWGLNGALSVFGAMGTLYRSVFKGGFFTYSGAYIMWSGMYTVSDNWFENNQATESGGAIYHDGFINPVMTNCTFINNVAGNEGGAVTGGAQSIYNNCRFFGNSAAYGGAVQVLGGFFGVGFIILNDCLFEGNSAQHGGVLYASNGPMTVTRGIFRENYSVLGGGVFLGVGSNVVTTSFTSCVFHNNSAPVAGVFAVQQGQIVNVVNGTFTSNYATSRAGVLSLSTESSVPFSIIDCSFTENTAPTTAVLEIASGTLLISNSRFIDNTAIVTGGALAVVGGHANVTSSVFRGNAAMVASGGAFFQTGGQVVVRDSVFDSNSAAAGGGAIQLVINIGGMLDLHTINCSFTENVAGLGGAIAMSSARAVIAGSQFTSNRAITARDIPGAGGAIYGDLCDVEISGTDLFNNSATGLGGAVATVGASEFSFIDSTLTSNTAVSGGAAYLTGPWTASHMLFDGNSALYGGAIYLTGGFCASPLLELTTFSNNRATKGGGGVFWQASEPACAAYCASTGGCTFSGNSAGYGADQASKYNELALAEGSRLPTKISPDTKMFVQINVLDYYGQTVTGLDGVDESMLIFLTVSGAKVASGQAVVGVLNGIALFQDIRFGLSDDDSLHFATNMTFSSRPRAVAINSDFVLTGFLRNGDILTASLNARSQVLAAALAIIGNWLALILVEQAFFGKREHKMYYPWLVLAAAALTLCGLWAPAIVGLTSIELPIALQYDEPYVFTSFLAGFPAVTISFTLLLMNVQFDARRVYQKREKMTATTLRAEILRQLLAAMTWQLFVGALFMIGGITIVTFVNMSGFQLSALVTYEPGSIISGLVVSYVICVGALILFFHFRTSAFRAAGAFVMAAAVMVLQGSLISAPVFTYNEGTSVGSGIDGRTLSLVASLLAAIVVLVLMGINIDRLKLSRNHLDRMVLLMAARYVKAQHDARNHKARALEYHSWLQMINRGRPERNLAFCERLLRAGAIKAERQVGASTGSVLGSSSGSSTGDSRVGQSQVTAIGTKELVADARGARAEGNKLADSKEHEILSHTVEPIKLADVIGHPVAVELLKDRLIKTLSAENLFFLLDAQAYARLPGKDERKVLAADMLVEYFTDNAPRLLNIDSNMKKRLVKKIESQDTTKELFHDVIKEVTKLISSNEWSKMSESADFKLCQMLIHTHKNLAAKRKLANANASVIASQDVSSDKRLSRHRSLVSDDESGAEGLEKRMSENSEAVGEHEDQLSLLDNNETDTGPMTRSNTIGGHKPRSSSLGRIPSVASPKAVAPPPVAGNV